ncbi:DUF3667 domain-containing protein [Pedobacter flavus]|uniref:DUF3667 domain-containing protein n=1 Tax=Pedobacter flavus TaxID=3113906 RepID=A0ABU7H2L3_9SPHI|nr:DUF3667 domain-containing protein [Pedobacter sp. VNH31]MEE1885559.1 DUF3667 domain-containing protein [Pedobacter sp. VNH31]
MSFVKHRKEKNCLNCGYTVDENFCSKCGQENLELKEDALHMMIHAIGDYFHFDNKFNNTMKPLLFKPGVLTKQYVEGKRATFLHPIKLYIFISILFFLFIFSTDSKVDASAEGFKTEELKDSLLKDTKVNLDASNDIIKEIKIQNPQPSDITYEDYLKRVQRLPEKDQPNFLEKSIAKAKIKYKNESIEKTFTNTFVKNTPKMMFVLLPLFAAILYAFHRSKERYYFEDLIYSFHIHSLIFLTLLIAKLLNFTLGFLFDPSTILFLIIWAYFTWYIYRSMRVFYGQSRKVTLLKMFLLSIIYFTLLAFCMTVLSLITLWYF